MNTDQKTVEEANREQLLRSLGHAGVEGALAALDTCYTAGFVRHGDKGDYDKARLGEGLRRLYAGFPDLKRVQFDIISQGDRVAYRWEATGTHLGEYLGVRPTHRPVIARGMVMCRFEDGLIAEEWASWNKASLLHDLGIIPLGR
jgi:predicted ester cyclase